MDPEASEMGLAPSTEDESHTLSSATLIPSTDSETLRSENSSDSDSDSHTLLSESPYEFPYEDSREVASWVDQVTNPHHRTTATTTMTTPTPGSASSPSATPVAMSDPNFEPSMALPLEKHPTLGSRCRIILAEFSDGIDMTGQLPDGYSVVDTSTDEGSYWLRILADNVMWSVAEPTEEGVYYVLNRLPRFYGLYEKEYSCQGTDENGKSITVSRMDKFIWGHPSGKKFDSTVKFFDHLMWLNTYSTRGGKCTCVLCDGQRMYPVTLWRKESIGGGFAVWVGEKGKRFRKSQQVVEEKEKVAAEGVEKKKKNKQQTKEQEAQHEATNRATGALSDLSIKQKEGEQTQRAEKVEADAALLRAMSTGISALSVKQEDYEDSMDMETTEEYKGEEMEGVEGFVEELVEVEEEGEAMGSIE